MSTLGDKPSDERVANLVAPALIGPPRRRKDGRWDMRGMSRRSLEATAASWVVDLLQAEGHRIDDLWSPDYDRSRRAEMPTRPELAMDLDGEPAALDVTMFLTQRRAKAGARAAAMRAMLEDAASAAARDRSVLGLVVYDIAGLAEIPRQHLDDERERLTAAIAAGVAAIPDVAESQAVSTDCRWVLGVSVTVHEPTEGGLRVSLIMMPQRSGVAAQVDEFVAERATSKARQLGPWGRSVLVIVHGWEETYQDVADGFARYGQLPLWRVYWVGASPEQIHLVASALPTP